MNMSRTKQKKPIVIVMTTKETESTGHRIKRAKAAVVFVMHVFKIYVRSDDSVSI